MRRAEKVLVVLNQALVGLMLAAVFVIVLVNVVLRYGFGASLAWGEETARFLMVAGAYFGAGLALREGRLVAITLVEDILPPRLRPILRGAVALLMIAFMAAIVWFGVQFAQFGWNKETMATQISRGIPYAAIPIGAGLFVLHSLFFFQRFVQARFEPEPMGASSGPSSGPPSGPPPSVPREGAR